MLKIRPHRTHERTVRTYGAVYKNNNKKIFCFLHYINTIIVWCGMRLRISVALNISSLSFSMKEDTDTPNPYKNQQHQIGVVGCKLRSPE